MYKVIIFSLLLYSCHSPTEHDIPEILKSKKSISFDIGFTPDMKLSGFFQDSLGEEFFFFSTYIDSIKKTTFFDLKGTKVRSVNLSTLSGKIKEIWSLEVINNNKIFITDINGELYELNEFGEITKKTNFNSILQKIQSGEHYLYPIVKTSCNQKVCSLYVLSYWYESDSINYSSLTSLSDSNFKRYIKFYSKKIKASPLAFALDLNDSLSAKPIFNSFYSNISSAQEFIPQFSFARFGNHEDYFFFTSQYSDSLWRYNLVTEEIESIQLKSNLIEKIGIKPIEIDTTFHKNLGLLYKDAKERINESSYISFIHYDRFKKLYYIIIKHNNLKVLQSSKNNNYGNHSVLVVNEKMDILNEYLLPEDNFISLSWVSKTGLIFAKYNTDKKGYDPRKYTVEIFDIEP